MKKIYSLVLLFILCGMTFLMTGCGDSSADKENRAAASNKLVIYTSMKESLIGGIVEGFKSKYPDIDVDYQSASAGKLMAKIAAERQSGHIFADVIWTSEVPDFYQMKKDGLLEIYKPSVFDELLNPFDDYDGSFTAARLGTLGIVVNTDKVSDLPKTWEDVATGSVYKNSFAIADPALSGTAFMSVTLLKKQFGDDYFVRLHNNGTRRGKGAGQVVDDTASGELAACLGVDYITAAKIDKGAHLQLVYPPELLMVPSPVAIFKGSSKTDAAKKFVDYLLSAEAQQKVANAGTVPVRTDVDLPEKYNLPTPQEAITQGIKVNYNEIMSTKEDTVKRFAELFK